MNRDVLTVLGVKLTPMNDAIADFRKDAGSHKDGGVVKVDGRLYYAESRLGGRLGRAVTRFIKADRDENKGDRGVGKTVRGDFENRCKKQGRKDDDAPSFDRNIENPRAAVTKNALLNHIEDEKRFTATQDADGAVVHTDMLAELDNLKQSLQAEEAAESKSRDNETVAGQSLQNRQVTTIRIRRKQKVFPPGAPRPTGNQDLTMVIHYPRSTLAERREQGRDAQQTNKTVEANNIDAQRETYTPPNGYHYRWNPPAAQEKHLIPTQSSDAALISFIRGETTFDDLSRALFEKD